MAIRMTRDTITSSLEKKIKSLSNLPEKSLTFFQQHTPVRSGNARRQTKLNKETIVADYSYAHILDKGASNQAPDGMSKPTLSFIQKEADSILKRK